MILSASVLLKATRMVSQRLANVKKSLISDANSFKRGSESLYVANIILIHAVSELEKDTDC